MKPRARSVNFSIFMQLSHLHVRQPATVQHWPDAEALD
jgi:hypothetical protein